MNDTTTTRPKHTTRWRLALIAVLASLALIAGACGDDEDRADDTSTPSTDSASADEAPDDDMTDDDMTDDDMADDDMADDDMADDDMADDGLEEIRAELAAAGLDDAQIVCVVDAVVAEWGTDVLTGPGRASDDQLLRLGEITFGCA